jgi:hypothetical protein
MFRAGDAKRSVSVDKVAYQILSDIDLPFAPSRCATCRGTQNTTVERSQTDHFENVEDRCTLESIKQVYEQGALPKCF